MSEQGGDLDKALKMSEYTIKREPERPTYLDTYAWILFKMGKARKALKSIRKASLYIEEQDAEILEHYGDILYELKRYKDAIEKWNEAMILDEERIIELSKKVELAKQRIR